MKTRRDYCRYRQATNARIRGANDSAEGAACRDRRDKVRIAIPRALPG